jgi:hypothetical protein
MCLLGICEEAAFEKDSVCDNPQKDAGNEPFKKEATKPSISEEPGDVH